MASFLLANWPMIVAALSPLLLEKDKTPVWKLLLNAIRKQQPPVNGLTEIPTATVVTSEIDCSVASLVSCAEACSRKHPTCDVLVAINVNGTNVTISERSTTANAVETL